MGISGALPLALTATPRKLNEEQGMTKSDLSVPASQGNELRKEKHANRPPFYTFFLG
jgi:hypothetical protein